MKDNSNNTHTEQHPNKRLKFSMPNFQSYLEELYKKGELSKKEYLQEMLTYFEEIYSNDPDILADIRANYNKKYIKHQRKVKRRSCFKKLFLNRNFDTCVFILHLINAYFLGNIISTSFTNWYSKYFLIGYSVFIALYIMAKMRAENYHTIEIHKFNLPYTRYKSNIEYIKKHEGYLEEDIVLKAVNRYGEQLELKKDTDSTFDNFETLYNHFKALNAEEKRELLYQLPAEYHTKLLKELIKQE